MDTQSITRTVPTSVGNLAVRVTGSGPPTVLWHSLFVDSTTWAPLRSHLVGYRQVISIDGPGHGASTAVPRRFTMEECAEAAITVLDVLGVAEPADWVGNAWGGHVGLVAAADTPDLCRTVVTIGTPTQALTRRERARIVPMVWAYRIAGPIPPLTNAVMNVLLGTELSRTHPQQFQAVSRTFRQAPRRGMHQAMQSIMLHRKGLGPLLPRIGAPTLMVVPRADTMISLEQARAAAATMPHAAATTVDGAGHITPLIADPAALADLITAFWRDPVGYLAMISTSA
ncbi:alpha/beta fold hydrolase [Rhodococcus opacus]|uniref:alpha/beta fold hydrolase n=1 Tax=Rhodococcus opacus TaxID=37919 RepID=UPI0024754CB7|nr:alpha/beta hydrolase [Rhodococcus opacus]MDH6286716.1 pimeloyl-ACP methyl ester carboxylesterase [Rhodococcus opacus]